MSIGWKAGMSATLLALALVAGEYLAGWLVILLLQVPITLGIGTYWEYYQAINLPQLVPYVGKIKLAGYGGFGLPLAIWLMLLVLMFKPRERAFHGDAQFTKRHGLKKAGLLKDSPEGIIIGMFGREFIRLCGTQHVIVVAPTRSGKSTGLAIPVLLTFGHSIVVLDVKGELYQLTSGYRKKLGQKIFVFAPYERTGRTHRFNPLATLSTNPSLRVSEIQTIGAILYPDTPGKDPFWTSQARAAFLAFTSFLFESWDQLAKAAKAGGRPLHPNTDVHFPSFERIYKLSTGQDGMTTKTMIYAFLSDPRYGYLSSDTRTGFSSLASLSEQTFSSVIASMQAPLQQFLSPILADATNACDFDIAMLRRHRMTIYVVIPPEKLGESGKLLNIFFSTVVGQNLRTRPEEDPTIKNQVLLLMDEFTSMGRVDAISDGISLAAGYWVRFMTIIQSLSQLDAVYGESVARTFRTNHAIHIVFTPREQRDAEEYSRQMGDTTVRRRNKTVGPDRKVSYTYTEERRPLMLPQELKLMKNDQELIFIEGCEPAKCKKIRYFKMSFFKKRLLPKVEIERIGPRMEESKVTTVFLHESDVRALEHAA